MSVHEDTHLVTSTVDTVHRSGPETATGGRALAVLRIATGLLFLWAFLDKTFGLGYATGSAKAWINGGSPTKGFLGSVDIGPFAGMLHSWAGTWWADWSFMLGLLGLGAAVTLGIGLRVTAVAGSVMMLLMWTAVWPLDRATGAGKATSSSNPLIDYHLIYALVLIVLAVTFAGHTWGLGRRWAGSVLVSRHRWLR